MEQSKEQLAVTEGNKLKTSKEHRQLVESFMGYADGYLSEWITWNDTMPVVEKIESMGTIIEIWLSLGRGCRIVKAGQILSIANTNSNSTIEAVLLAVIEFIKWHRPELINNQDTIK
jgi:hypothetical protein